MSIKISGSVLVVGSAEINEAEFETIDGMAESAGTAVASKAVVLDSSKHIVGLGNISGANLSGSGNLTIGGTVRLDGAADATAVVGTDSFYFMDSDNLVKKETMVDYAALIAGDGLKAASGVLAVDFNELIAADVNVANDDIIFIDADGNVTRKDSIADLATGMAGVGLAASGGQFAMDVNELGAITSVDDGDLFALQDVTDNSTKKMTRANLLGSAEAAFSSGLTSTTISGSGAANLASLHCDSVDLDGGAMDGVIIGAAEAAAASVTTLAASSTSTLQGVTATTISGSGAANLASLHCDSVDLDGGAIDGVVIGAASAAAGTFTAISGTTVSGSGAAQFASLHSDSVNLDGGAMDGVVIGAASAAAGTFTAIAGTTVSGSGAAQFASLHCDSVNLDGGSIDATAIGAGTRAAGAFTTLGANAASTLAAVTATTISGSGAANLASLHCDSVNLDGGNIDGVVIGASAVANASVANLVAASAQVSDLTAGRVTFAGASGELSDAATFQYSTAQSTLAPTNLSCSSNIMALGTLSIDGETNLRGASNVHGVFTTLGNANLGNANSDVTTLVGQVTSSAGMHISAKSGVYALSVADGAGDAIAQAWVTHSDRNLKTNIQELDNDAALNAVMSLQPSTYEKKATGKSEIGFIAQEVAQVVPEICALDANGEGRGIDYSRMSTLLAGALKAQQEQIAQLKEIVAKLQK